MRWEGLFADLEAQASQLAAAARGAEVEERGRIEVGTIGLVDRLRPALGAAITLRCRAGVTVTGCIRRVNLQWLLIAEDGGREALVPIAAIVAVSGLGRLSAVPNTMGPVESKLGITHALRGVARDRSAVRMLLADSTVLDGTLDRVGADFVEVSVHAPGEPRRHREVRDVVVVAISAIVVLRRDA
ncbi:MAG TPA: hypothetical protein VGH11_08405 [Jatrophihabitans sp.]